MNGQKSIFLTGATGFLGTYLIRELLYNSQNQLYCLVRSRKRQCAPDRLRQELEALDQGLSHPSLRERIHVLEGDITQAGLGISASALPNIDEVWHCAAVLNFEHHKEKETLEINVGGVQHVLDFIRDRQIPTLNFISTAYVAGQASGRIPAAYFEHDAPVNNPYELSKRRSEAAIVKAHERTGLHYRILRPSIIIGDSESLKASSYSGLYGYLAILLRLKDSIELKMPDYFKYNPLKILLKKGASINLICVDHVAKNIHSLCDNNETINRVFHITNPFPNPIEQTIRIMGEAFGIETLPVFDKEKLGPIDYLLLAEQDIFNSYLEATQYFECHETYTLTGFDAARLHLPPKRELRVMQEMKKKFDNDQRVQRTRLKSITHKLERKTITLSGLEPLTYYKGGKGPVIVILNAYGQSLAFWDRIVDRLIKHYTVIIWSMRGTSSQTGGVNEVYPLETHREDIKAILDQEEKTRCHLLAWCTGPKIALEFNAHYPDYVASMVFLSGCYKGIDRFSHLHTSYENDMQEICSRVDERPEITAFVIDTLKNILAGEKEEQSYQALVDSQKRNLIHEIMGLISKDIKPMVIEPFLSVQSALNYGRQLLLFWKEDPQNLIRKLEKPVLLITGKEDKIASSAMSEAVADLSPMTSCATITGGTHYLHYHQFELLSDIIRSFTEAGPAFSFKHGLVKIKNKAPVEAGKSG